MAITYTNYRKVNRLREPNFERSRAVYRGPRSSYCENLESGLFLEDIRKINQELSNTESKISENQNIFIRLSSEESFNKIEDIEFYYDSGSGPELQQADYLKIPVLNQLCASLKRLDSKVNRLERGEYNG